ncbi:MAG: response regulator [Alphaproteobacteria bacterium]
MPALIIEDNSEIRRILRISLEAAGIETRTAKDGKHGLALMKDTRFDFIVTDILMPEMDGLEVIQAVGAGHKGVKIIAISGGGRTLPGPEVLGMAKILGADAALSKPFTPSGRSGGRLRRCRFAQSALTPRTPPVPRPPACAPRRRWRRRGGS